MLALHSRFEKKVIASAARASAKPGIADLPNLTETSAVSLVEQLTNERAAIENELVRQLRSDFPVEKKIPAICLLGFNRMDGAVQDMLKFITLEVPAKSHFRAPPWETRPTVEALIRIGKPATKALLKHLESVEDEQTRKLSIVVISHIEGPEVGRFSVETAIKKQTDPEKKKKLREGLRYFAEQ